MVQKSLFRHHFRTLTRTVAVWGTRLRSAPRSVAPIAGALPGALLLAFVSLLGAETSVLSAQGRPDQVLWTNPRGRLTTDSGKVVEHSLARVVIESNGREKSISNENVERVTYGRVPTSFSDGRALSDRGEHAQAAAEFLKAAADAAASDVVKARAQLLAGQAFLAAGAQDASNFEKAKLELQTFVDDHGESGDLPHGRWLLGRAQRLAGDSGDAAATWLALYGEAPSGTPNEGYRATQCFRAGVDAAYAFLADGQQDKALETFRGVEAPLAAALSGAEEGTPLRRALQNLQAHARLGEGFVLLATDATSQAKTFFSGQLRGAGDDASLTFGATLGLAEALLAEGNAREAQLEFAKVSAIDHTDRDRTARALVGLARAALQLPESSAKSDAKNWLQVVKDRYGDTPAALDAKELSQSI